MSTSTSKNNNISNNNNENNSHIIINNVKNKDKIDTNSNSISKIKQNDNHLKDILNPFTTSFDASRALVAEFDAIVSSLPYPFDVKNIKKSYALDNLSACTRLLDAPYRLLQKQKQKPSKQQQQQQQYNNETILGKRLRLKPSATISTTSSHTRIEQKSLQIKTNSNRVRRVLQIMMDKTTISNGPLSTLSTAVAHRRRVRVVIRNRHRIRGYLISRLVAFDKHFNLVLRDAVLHERDDDSISGTVSSSTQKRFPLTLLRGEHVVSISTL